MKSKSDDLYLLMDGTYASPGDCSDKDGVWQHSSGVKVALTDAGEPMTLARVTEHNVAANEAAAAPVESEPVAESEKPAVAEKPAHGNLEQAMVPESDKPESKPEAKVKEPKA